MANRISPQKIEEINEVYAQCGVKTKTAKIVGVSVASVSKYLIEGYIPKAARVVYEFTKEPKPITDLKSFLDNLNSITKLTNEEWEDMQKLQREEVIF